MRAQAVVKRGVLLVALLFLPAVASAQSAISGVVRDTTGAVLPGVTIEASSPVLIEKTRAAVTDASGLYTIVDLRPGTYVVTFSLSGFSTLRREGVELPSNFTMTLNADLRVGALEESITVTGDTPVVDVQSTQRTQVLTREMLDAVPTARNYSGLAALMPGVRSSNTDVGGNQQMEQIYMTVRGSRQTDTTIQVDGMMLNSLMNDGQVQAYFSDAAQAEMSFQTSAVGADVSGGGVRINMIPKDGGNMFSGSAFVGGTKGSWQADNVTDELRARRLESGDAVAHITDFNFSLGGPIKKDKLWFFGSWRRISTDEVVANSFKPDGSSAVEDQWIQNQMLRMTWQVTPRNKFSAYQDRYPKFKGHELGAFTEDDATRRRDNNHALYYTAQGKWTSTVTSRFLLEGGYSSNVEYFTGLYQPGVAKERFSPEWYSTVGHFDITTTRQWEALNTPSTGNDPKRFVLSGSGSYVTGAHSFKSGVQWSFGNSQIDRDFNGDLLQRYRLGVPDSVIVYNTPVVAKEHLNADMGIYAQDSWRIDRMTLNMGVRFEYFNASISEQTAGTGRFAPLRSISEVPDMPSWSDVAPRLGVAYDLFGDARTALKASFNRYMAGQALGFPGRYNPLALRSETRTWRDTNGDDIAQDSEIGPKIDQRFGEAVATLRPDADMKREYDLEYSFSVQHQVIPRVAVTAAWYRRGTYNTRRTDNLLVGLNDYAAVPAVNPLTGETYTLYNLNVAKRGQVESVDFNSTEADLRSRTYQGFEFGGTTRIGRGNFFGGWTFDRLTNVTCDSRSDPNTSRHCDQAALGMPFRHEFKVAGSYNLWYGIQANLALQSYAGVERGVNWVISPTTRYAANCPGPCAPGALVIPGMTLATLTSRLVEPGTLFFDRLNQVDVGFRKLFRIGKYQWSGQADIFNITNSNKVKTQNQTFGANLDQPLSILQPRTLRLAVQMKF
jgi:hypothetical protein